MNKLVIILAGLSIIVFNGSSQTLTKNEVDEFTGHKIKITSYEVLSQTFKVSAFVSIRNIDDTVNILQLKLMLGAMAEVHSIDKGASLYLKLTDGQVIQLKNMEYAISCTGCGARGFSGSGAQGTQTFYELTSEQSEKLAQTPIDKIRITTNSGYVDQEIRGARASVIKDEFAIIKLWK